MSIDALVERAIRDVMGEIATEGLEALRTILHDSGFLENEFLKSYELYSIVRKQEIVFEILIEFEALDEETQSALESNEEEDTGLDENGDVYSLPSTVSRLYGRARKLLGITGGKRDARERQVSNHDARIPARDARRDARKNSTDRKMEREIASVAPRKMKIDRSGKLALKFKREIEQNGNEIRYPKGDFQGIIAKFIIDLQSIIVSKFAPRFEEILYKSLEDKF